MKDDPRKNPPDKEDKKDFVADFGSDVRKTPVRVAFLTRRTSPQVHADDDEYVFTYPVAFFTVAVVVEMAVLALVWIALLWDAPLEGIADPAHTPNPAKAPWYFLGLQELLHYFPPFVAGVLIPTLVIFALVIIPYFNINIEADGMFTKDRRRRIRIFSIIAIVLSLFLLWFEVYVSLIPTLVIIFFMGLAAKPSPAPSQRFLTWVHLRPLSFWMMTWFMLQFVILTVVGTFFRGAGWSWVLPWRTP